jgi:hypothetical protein
MTDTKISQLPQQSTATTSDKIPVVQGGVTYYELISDIISLFFNNYPASDPSITGWNTKKDGAAFPLPSAITYNGNSSYSLVFSGVDLTSLMSAGMRLRLQRTATPPSQCTSLNGTTQFYNKVAPAGMTFTDDFVASAWVKPSSYAQGEIQARWNGSSGWQLEVSLTGQVLLVGFNAASANFSQVQSYQSLPLNRWTHVAAQLDMSAFTPTTSTSYIMFNGTDVPAAVSRGGTNPTALLQAGNYEVGSRNGGLNPFPGKLAQVAIYSAKVTQSTVRASISQGLSGAETSLVSAYSFSNSVNDLNTTNANNLTAQAGASATNADSPFSQQADSTVSNKDYAIVEAASFASDTTLVVQVPEGNAIPTSGGISAVAYSMVKAPFGMPIQRSKWAIEVHNKTDLSQASPTASVWYNLASLQVNAPIGEWFAGYEGQFGGYKSAAVEISVRTTLSTTSSTESNNLFTSITNAGGASGTIVTRQSVFLRRTLTVSTPTTFYQNFMSVDSLNSLDIDASIFKPFVIILENAYL